MQTPEARADAVIEEIWPGDPFSGPWKQAVAQAIREAAEAAAPRWIPVGERLPDEGENVLVMSTGFAVAVGYLDRGDWQIIGGEFAYADSVEYWMPKPADPVS
jgi:hypothetical protein